jgi:hypothetical protein
VAKGDHSNIFDIQKCLNEILEGLEVPLVAHIPVSEPLAQYNALHLPVRANVDKYSSESTYVVSRSCRYLMACQTSKP